MSEEGIENQGEQGGTATDVQPEGGSPEGGGESTSPSWLESVPEDIRADPSLQSFKDPGSLAKSYLEARRMIGADKIALPGKNATPEERDEFYNRLGRPEKPDGYQLPEKGLPEGFQPHEERLNAMRDIAHKVGITSDQFAELTRADANFMAEVQQQQEQQVEQQREEALGTLRKEWGSAFEDKMGLVDQAIQFAGEDPEFMEMLGDGKFGDRPAMARFLAKVGREIASDSIHGEGVTKQFGMAPAEAQAEINRLNADGDFMKTLQDKTDPKYVENNKKYRELFEKAYPGE